MKEAQRMTIGDPHLVAELPPAELVPFSDLLATDMAITLAASLQL